MANTSIEQDLRERIKELTCLYDITSVFVQNSVDIEETLYKICHILKAAWKYSDNAVVELQLLDLYIQTSKIPEHSIFQESKLVAGEKVQGFLRVHYPTPRFNTSHFLLEEQKLLNKVGFEILGYYNKKQQKEQQEKLKRALERNDRLNILGEITAGIAHELNTPLGNILGFAELIENSSENDQVKKDADKIIKAAIYSREVVKKLMFFSCEMPQNRKMTLIDPIVSQALVLLNPNFKKAQVDYELQNKAPQLKAQVDTIQLTQVLFNLLINSLYASPPHTTIKVIVAEKNENLSIKICDEGSGIKEENLSKIFEPFFTTRPIGEGSGLGLSVVHGIVKSHKGSIHVSKNEPKGAIFEIILPLKL